MPDRMIRESICTSDTLNQLTDFEERFWHRLIVNCDDYGRFDARPAILKGKLFPLADGKTKKDMSDALNKLASVGLVELYEVDGKPFLHVVTWSKYQRTRAIKSKYPAPDNACRQLTANVPVIVSDNRNRNREAEAVCARAREDAAPAGFTLPPMSRAVEAFCNKINPTPSQRSLAELESFEAQMGTECCLRAIDEALDARATNWNYIQKILRSKLERGVRCIADWDKLEEKRNARKPDKQDAAGGSSADERWNLKSHSL